VRGIDVDGTEVVVEDDDYLARVMQHEIDHLDGVLLLDRLEPTERKAAMRELRHLFEGGLVPSGDGERVCNDLCQH